MEEEQVLVKIKMGRGSHTTIDRVLHRSSDAKTFLIDVNTFEKFGFKFDPCDPETEAPVVQSVPIAARAGLKEKVKAAAEKTAIPVTTTAAKPRVKKTAKKV